MTDRDWLGTWSVTGVTILSLIFGYVVASAWSKKTCNMYIENQVITVKGNNCNYTINLRDYK